MEPNREERERTFEYALIQVLAHEYDLDVRHERDRMERRKREMATLDFEYHYVSNSSSEAKAVISIAGADYFSNLLPVNFASEDSILRSAESCEALARFIRDYLARARDRTLDEIAEGALRYGRREDDLS